MQTLATAEPRAGAPQPVGLIGRNRFPHATGARIPGHAVTDPTVSEGSGP